MVCLLLLQAAWAQKDSLQFDESNIYVYYHVVDKPGLSADTLFKRAWYFAKAADYMIKIEALPNAFTTTGKFLIYSGVSVVKKESGEVNYTLLIETKDNKYRYKLGGFVFTPYKRDRFGNMVAVPGIKVPLEKLLSKYSLKEANPILDQAGGFAIATGNKLSSFMERTSSVIKIQTVKKVATDRW